MTNRDKASEAGSVDRGRRNLLGGAASLGLGAIAAPFFSRRVNAQTADLEPYGSAKINWRQAEGEQITVGVIPAGYFDNLVSITSEFEALIKTLMAFDALAKNLEKNLEKNVTR